MNSKREGEISQAAFIHRALQNGLSVLVPVGDSDRYDCVLNQGRRFCRVQIRSTKHMSRKNVYHVPAHFRVRRGHGPAQQIPYTEKEIDCLAATIVPEDTWFIVQSPNSTDASPSSSIPKTTANQAPSENSKKPGTYFSIDRPKTI